MLPHLLEPFARDAPAAGHVLQERHHVLGLLGTAEGDDQEGVVRLHVGVTRRIHAARVERPTMPLVLDPTAGCWHDRERSPSAAPPSSPGCRSPWSGSASCCSSWSDRLLRAGRDGLRGVRHRRGAFAVLHGRWSTGSASARAAAGRLGVRASGLALMIRRRADVRAPWPHLCAALAGAAHAPDRRRASGPAGRTWSTDTAELHTAFAFEAVVDETVFILGPVLVTVLATTVHPLAGLTSASSRRSSAPPLVSQRRTEPPRRTAPTGTRPGRCRGRSSRP